MLKISPIKKLRITILVITLFALGILVWILYDKNAACKVVVIAEKTEAITYEHGTQQQAEIVSISLNSPLQKLFLTNTGTGKIYRIDLFIFLIAAMVFYGIETYFRIYSSANPFHKTIENLLSFLFILLSIYILCRCFFFIDSYNTFIDARLPNGLKQFRPHESNPAIAFLLLPLFEIYKFMIEKGRLYKEEIDMVV